MGNTATDIKYGASSARWARNLKISLLLLLVTASLLYALYLTSKSRTFQFFGEIIARVETDQKVVALTFDDAPSPYSDSVLEILADKQVPATFYVIGQNLERYPEQGKAIALAGHELGNHSYSHQRFLLKSYAFVDAEIQQTNELIRQTGYSGEITFRPPFSKKLFMLPWYLARHHTKTVMFDVEAETYLPQSATDTEKRNFIVDHTLQNTKPGSIILLHPFCESCGSTRDAIGPIVDGLRAQGFQLVAVSQLLKQ